MKKFDFGGYATRAGLECSDGAVIEAAAFKHQNREIVPLVWQHLHDDPNNILGHAELEHRSDGIYAYAVFNDTPQGQNAKELVRHGDIRKLSIYANKLKRRGAAVVHGAIREVSLVINGANPGAYIDNVSIAHGDSYEVLDDEAIIFTGLDFKLDEEVQHADNSEGTEMGNENEKTVGDIYASFTEEQKNVVAYMIGEAVSKADGDDAEHSDSEGEAIYHNDQEDTITMTRNVFESLAHGGTNSADGDVLSHADQEAIFKNAQKLGSFRDAVIAHADQYGITDIETLFPDAKNITTRPEFVKRRTEWVAGVMSDTHHVPFSRIKTMFADITEDEARAKGYIKGNKKLEEVFSLMKRITTPQTIYKKQKLDRDDVIDITDFDVVVWVREEMRLMLEEEIAAAALVSDGRSVADPDKIKSPAPGTDGAGIRAIALDDEFYAPLLTIDKDDDLVDSVVLSLVDYEGSGSPKFYTSPSVVANLLLEKDTLGRRLYSSRADLATSMGVSEIVDIPASILARGNSEEKGELVGIVVNLRDYTFGANAGGKTTAFDDFDIDYNQYKYLLEARLTGCLTRWKSAVVIRRKVAATPAP